MPSSDSSPVHLNSCCSLARLPLCPPPSIVCQTLSSLPLPSRPTRFDGLTTLLKSQAGLHGTAGPGGQRPSIKGLYMYGGVGCGKTMLMDLLVAAAPPEFQVSVAVLSQ